MSAGEGPYLVTLTRGGTSTHSLHGRSGAAHRAATYRTGGAHPRGRESGPALPPASPEAHHSLRSRRSEEPSRLPLGFDAHWDKTVGEEQAGVLDYQLEEASGDATRLTVTLSEMVGQTSIAAERDTPPICSSLKSQLEMGEQLAIN